MTPSLSPMKAPPSDARGTRNAIAVILALSAAIVLFLFWLIYFQKPATAATGSSILPFFNACCNALAAGFITSGILAIHRGQRRLHAWCMASATFFSASVLVGYLIYHYTHGHSTFGGTGWIRTIYLLVLVSHIVLSALVVPMILSTLFFALRRQWNLHRKIARWTYPVWLYVSVTGIVVFVFLRI